MIVAARVKKWSLRRYSYSVESLASRGEMDGCGLLTDLQSQSYLAMDADGESSAGWDLDHVSCQVKGNLSWAHHRSI